MVVPQLYCKAIQPIVTSVPVPPPLRMLSRMKLREIARRRRGDADVIALLWEIRRLHEAMADIYDLVLLLPKSQFDVQHVARWKCLAAAMLASQMIVRQQNDAPRSRFDPSLPDTRPLKRWKPQREAPTENEEERAAKRRARQERG